MPTGTRVHRCVEKVKRKGGGVNPYAVCQAATGQSFATGRKAKGNHMLETPKGDLGVKDDPEYARFFHRKIKQAGKEIVSSKELPYHPESMAIDPKFGPGDKVS